MYLKVACTETHKLIYITQAAYPDLDENLDISPVSSSSLSQIMLEHTWAATCVFQQCGTLASADPDGPSQPPFKPRNPK